MELEQLLEQFYQEYKIFYEGSILDFILNRMEIISRNSRPRYITSYYFRHRNIGQTEHDVFKRITAAISKDMLLDLKNKLLEERYNG